MTVVPSVRAGSIRPPRSAQLFTVTHFPATAELPVIEQPATLIELADANPPATPLTAAASASEDKSTNFGNAVAAKIPRITITIINSISVKPACFFISILLKVEVVPDLVTGPQPLQHYRQFHRTRQSCRCKFFGQFTIAPHRIACKRLCQRTQHEQQQGQAAQQQQPADPPGVAGDKYFHSVARDIQLALCAA